MNTDKNLVNEVRDLEEKGKAANSLIKQQIQQKHNDRRHQHALNHDK